MKSLSPVGPVFKSPITGLTSELTINSGTLCTIETVAVEMCACCFPFLFCSLREKRVGVRVFSNVHSLDLEHVVKSTVVFLVNRMSCLCVTSYCVRSCPHSAHSPFITMGWLHSSILMMTPLEKTEEQKKRLAIDDTVVCFNLAIYLLQECEYRNMLSL